MPDRILHLNDDDIVLTVTPTRESLHAAVNQLYALGRSRFDAASTDVIDTDTGEVIERRYFVALVEDRLSRSQRQHRFYRGPVLRQISEQAPGGWTPDAWHEAFKRTFLGYEVERVQVAGRKRATTIRRLRSTTGLSVRQMSEYLEQVIATAATDLGVVFDLDPAERDVALRRPKKRKAVERDEVAA